MSPRRQSPRRFSRTLAVCLAIVAQALLTALAPAPGLAATTVPGSEYEVSFKGSAEQDRAWDETGYWSAEQTGSWTVEDVPVSVWLPTAYSSAEEGGRSTAPAYSPYNGLLSGEPKDPASLTESGTGASQAGEQEAYTCNASVIEDRGVGKLGAGVVQGNLEVATSYDGAERRFVLPEGEEARGRGYWTCSAAEELEDAPAFIETPWGETTSVAYAATVPFGDVGQAGFTLPVTDRSTVDQLPYCGGACTKFEFGVSGAYTFTKVCDGAIAYAGEEATGTCGAAAAVSGGSGGSSGAGAGTGTGKSIGLPDTILRSHPKAKLKTRKATVKARFTFASDQAGATFRCALDKGKLKPCTSPATYTVKPGKHSFRVEALGAAGADPTPAGFSFKVVREKRHVKKAKGRGR